MLAVAIATLAAILGACEGSDRMTTPASPGSAVAATTGPATAASVDSDLRRPPRWPDLAPGAPCPVTERIDTIPGYPLAVPGPGPVYPILPSGTLHLSYEGGFAGSGWGGQKVLWVTDFAYNGPVLIRGRQLDGPNELRFDDGTDPATEIQIPQGPTGTSGGGFPAGWRQRPSFTRARATGCYAYQVDGQTFSYAIVFLILPGKEE